MIILILLSISFNVIPFVNATEGEDLSYVVYDDENEIEWSIFYDNQTDTQWTTGFETITFLNSEFDIDRSGFYMTPSNWSKLTKDGYWAFRLDMNFQFTAQTGIKDFWGLYIDDGDGDVVYFGLSYPTKYMEFEVDGSKTTTSDVLTISTWYDMRLTFFFENSTADNNSFWCNWLVYSDGNMGDSGELLFNNTGASSKAVGSMAMLDGDLKMFIYPSTVIDFETDWFTLSYPAIYEAVEEEGPDYIILMIGLAGVSMVIMGFVLPSYHIASHGWFNEKTFVYFGYGVLSVLIGYGLMRTWLFGGFG